MTTIQVRCIPLDGDLFWVDCTECGPLEVVESHLVHPTAMEHLSWHGVGLRGIDFGRRR